MNTPLPTHIRRRRSAAYSILEEICQELELTQTQMEKAKVSYEAVADWLSKSPHQLLQNLSLYTHGSVALGTTVRPLFREDFDVDLICRVMGLPGNTAPDELKRLIGDRLREHATYAPMLEEKKRCWRLNYAHEFHLDISPTIPNPECGNGGELVPDKSVKAWKPTNPTGYREMFERRCEILPRMRLEKQVGFDELVAGIMPFPAQQAKKGVLRRIVQLLKRHRDLYFAQITDDVAPISILITTLAAQSYEYCCGMFQFDTELDIVTGVIRMMPWFIQRTVENGQTVLVVANESTKGENFAERWKSEPQRAEWFYKWHVQALADFENFAAAEGVDTVMKTLSPMLGEKVVAKVMDSRTSQVTGARSAQKLFVGSAGLTLSGNASATPVARNTHFGDRKK